jgi:hypothetical protein
MNFDQTFQTKPASEMAAERMLMTRAQSAVCIPAALSFDQSCRGHFIQFALNADMRPETQLSPEQQRRNSIFFTCRNEFEQIAKHWHRQ